MSCLNTAKRLHTGLCQCLPMQGKMLLCRKLLLCQNVHVRVRVNAVWFGFCWLDYLGTQVLLHQFGTHICSSKANQRAAEGGWS